jgi:multimeric flavodoxin WrbA
MGVIMRILGLSASLRNARYGSGSEAFIADLQSIETKDGLFEYLEKQTKFRFDDFVASGRDEKKPFDEIYKELRKLRGERGLSNSEGALAASLWGAAQEGAEIRHVSLSSHFPMTGKGRDLDQLRSEIINADAIIVSGPVYFGDRGSLAQSLLEFLAADEVLAKSCRGKIYAGLAVGAKRNGGQETTLIYQMLDMINLDFLAVGNSSETTSQYGGTVVAGDVGKMHEDEYGINTCIGTGQRVARVAKLIAKENEDYHLKDPLKIQLWLLQDTADGDGRKMFDKWCRDVSGDRTDIDFQIFDLTREEVTRCIACDICPTHVGPTEEYRCIIKTAQDFFVRQHEQIVEADAVLLCAYSPEDRSTVVSVYQQFIERTRYLRRDNYVLSDLLCAPFVISELSARQNLNLRMMTSGMRHHTIVHHPIIGMVQDGELLNPNRVIEVGKYFVENARKLAIGRHRVGAPDDLLYHPIGYEISAEKALDDKRTGRTKDMLDKVAESRAVKSEIRLKKI